MLASALKSCEIKTETDRLVGNMFAAMLIKLGSRLPDRKTL